MKNQNKNPRLAMTLMELVIVISILVVLATISIPVVRVVTKGRKVREAARVVESMFATARDDAIVKGFSGIELVRNRNFVDGSTRLYKLRRLPPYSGFDFDQTVLITEAAGVFTVDFGIYPPPLGTINPGDYIKFGNKLPMYEIVSGGGSMWVINVDASQPGPPTSLPLDVPPVFINLSFQVYRRPVRIDSSAVDLPNGQFVDLSVSGDSGTEFPEAAFPGTGSVFIYFDNKGAIDKIFPDGRDNVAPPSFRYHGNGTLYFLVASDDEAQNPGSVTLDNMDNLWVSINSTNGSVSVNDISETPGPVNAVRIQNARSIARKKRSATQ